MTAGSRGEGCTYLGGIRQVLALLYLQLVVQGLPVVGDGEDGVSPRHGLDQGRLIVEVC